jgi:hypothetical protein
MLEHARECYSCGYLAGAHRWQKHAEASDQSHGQARGGRVYCILLIAKRPYQAWHTGCHDFPTRAHPMKITMNVECTPEEARAFLGLPDVRPMQEQLLREVQERMVANVRAMEPDAMLRTWLPATLKGFEQLQEMFLSQLTTTKKE